jgi:hypothetical protein
MDMSRCQNPDCPRFGDEILVMAHRGLGYCSIDCRKALGWDMPSLGTMMFVTRTERSALLEARNG